MFRASSNFLELFPLVDRIYIIIDPRKALNYLITIFTDFCGLHFTKFEFSQFIAQFLVLLSVCYKIYIPLNLKSNN